MQIDVVTDCLKRIAFVGGKSLYSAVQSCLSINSRWPGSHVAYDKLRT